MPYTGVYLDVRSDLLNYCSSGNVRCLHLHLLKAQQVLLNWQGLLGSQV